MFLDSSLSTQTIIIGEIFLALFAIGGYLVFYLLSLNSELDEKNTSISRKLRNAKSRAKGFRVQIQELNGKIAQLESQVQVGQQGDNELKTNLKAIEKENQSLEKKITKLIVEKNKAKDQLKSSKIEIKALESKLKAKKRESDKTENSKDNYKELYYDLKNSIAYNMSGGEQAIDLLRDRLAENGNREESEQVDLLKERYNSIGTMVGLVEDVELFHSSNTDNQEDLELKAIENAEGLVEGIRHRLEQAENFEHRDTADLVFSQQEMDLLVKELQQVIQLKEDLTSDLDKTSSQLRAFVSKARMFQAQKEQISMHKATEAQMHRNLTTLGNDYRQLSRRFKTLEARNEILNTQIKRSTDDDDLIEKLSDLRSRLEGKEEKMDRLQLEKEMLEQQFMLMSAESDIELESSKTLERLEAEHQLLEQQFLELLKDFEKAET